MSASHTNTENPLRRENRIALSTMLAALLAKHRVIDRAAVEDPEGYDKGQTSLAIHATAGDLLEFCGGVFPTAPQGDDLDDALRKAVEADFEQLAVQSLTPSREYDTPIHNVKGLLLQMLTAAMATAVAGQRLPADTLPDKAGFYWWRADAATPWRMIHVVDWSAGVDHRVNLVTYDVHTSEWSGRPLRHWEQFWKPGEWVMVTPPAAEVAAPGGGQ